MRYRFGAFELDADQYELREGTRVLHVEPRVLDVLFFLVRNRERIVSRDELLDDVWKTRYIGESALSRCIMQARKAITTKGADEPIKTIHRRGYRFVATVTEVNGSGVGPAAVEARTTPKIDPQAEKLCARARQLWQKRSPVTMRTAISLLQQAIELEPGYARAYSALADCYVFVGFLHQTKPTSVFPKAEAANARAIELDPLLAEAHASRGFIQTVYRWNSAEAERSFLEAIRLDPELAVSHHWYGMLLLTQRRFEEAEQALRRAVELDPLSPIYATACGIRPMSEGHADKAIQIYQTVIESEPAFFPVHFYLGLALEDSGRVDQAIVEFEKAAKISQSETEALPAMAHALARAGRTDEAQEVVARMRAAAGDRFISPFFFAVAAMGMDDRETTMALLREAVAIRAMRMNDLHLDRRFAPLRDDPRFLDLLREIGMDPELRG